MVVVVVREASVEKVVETGVLVVLAAASMFSLLRYSLLISALLLWRPSLISSKSTLSRLSFLPSPVAIGPACTCTLAGARASSKSI